uniref:transposase n=1 Tax=Candidatus Enterovibrio escicola TaxID=1927127 RepID=UPI000BE39EAE
MAFVDSSKLQVCHNLRIFRHQVLKGTAKRIKGTMGSSTVSNYTLSSMTKVVLS